MLFSLLFHYLIVAEDIEEFVVKFAVKPAIFHQISIIIHTKNRNDVLTN